MIQFIKLTILCNKDEREEEDIKLASQLEVLGIATSPETPKVIQEWRGGLVAVHHIEGFYPHGKMPEHTVMHMTSGSIITIHESAQDIADTLSKLNNNNNGNSNYHYTVDVSKLPV